MLGHGPHDRERRGATTGPSRGPGPPRGRGRLPAGDRAGGSAAPARHPRPTPLRGSPPRRASGRTSRAARRRAARNRGQRAALRSVVPPAQVFIEPELAHEPQEHVDREAIELLRAEDEVRREESPDLRIGNAGQQVGQLFRARRHGWILRETTDEGLRSPCFEHQSRSLVAGPWSTLKLVGQMKRRFLCGSDAARSFPRPGASTARASRDPRLRRRGRGGRRADAGGGPAAAPRGAQETGRLLAADADRAGADARFLGDLHDGPRSGRPRDLRLPEARPGRPRADLRGRRRNDGADPLRQVEPGRPRPRRGARLLDRGGPALRLAPQDPLVSRSRRARRARLPRSLPGAPRLAARHAAGGQEQPQGRDVLERCRARAPRPSCACR